MTGVNVRRKLLDYGYSSAVCSSASRSPQGVYGGYETTLIVAIIKLCCRTARAYF